MFNAQDRKIKKLGITLLCTSLALSSMMLPALAVPPDYTVLGNVNIPGLSASQCVSTDASMNLISTGFACGSGSGTVTAVTGSGNILSSGGTTPNITTVAAPTFAGALTAGSLTTAGALSALSLTGTGLTPGDCVQTTTGGLLTTTASACSTGVVQSVTAGTNISVTGTTAAPVVNVAAAPTFAGTVTAANVIDSGLTANQCVRTNASSQLSSSGELCPTTYISGTRAGGLHIETSQQTPSATTPWEATMTFAVAYTAAPFCTTNIVNATPLYSGATIVSESTTAVTIFDASQQGYTYNVICIGY